jgi:hypothetical protein
MRMRPAFAAAGDQPISETHFGDRGSAALQTHCQDWIYRETTVRDFDGSFPLDSTTHKNRRSRSGLAGVYPA